MRGERARRGWVLPSWTEAEAAYIAGFIDGEGSVSLTDRGDAAHKPYPAIQLANTHLGVMEWLAERLGGTQRPYARLPAPRRKQQYQLNATNGRAVDILHRVRPF